MDIKDIVLQAMAERAWSNSKLVELAEGALAGNLKLECLDEKFIKKYNLKRD
jgi:hypothetical protein